MKKLVSLLLILAMLFACGCGVASDETLPTDDSGEATLTESQSEPSTEEELPEETEVPLPPREPVVLSKDMQQKLGSYLPNDWKTKLEQIHIEDEETFAFAIQTDTHFSVKSGQTTANSAKALSHFIPLDFIANTGDLVKGYSDVEENTPENTAKSMSELVRRYTEDVNCPVLLTFGNHDTNQIWCKENGETTDQLNKYDHYELVISKLQETNGDAMTTDGESTYYYVDFTYDKIRVIMLNTSDADYLTEFGSLSYISKKQAEWFQSVALDTDYAVIVMQHVPLMKYFPNNENWSVVNSVKITAAVNEFVAAGGHFIAYMYGHTHNQSHFVDRDNRLHLSFKNGGNRAEIVTVDTVARKIVTYGLGGAEDRQFDY